ncbi:hypothetical protein [Bradyrhizobium sp. S3.9.1]|uniref:hypothetical protein n=1 Tax=Bradyrhizobium sp. S3.9.1 TaxID=3156431 RepID=UPI003394F87E
MRGQDDRIAGYIAERDAAVTAGVDALIAFSAKYGHRPSDRDVATITLHKLRTAIRSLPLPVRLASHEWLSRHGFESWGFDA